MHSFKQSCITALEKLALKIDSKQIPIPKPEIIDSQDTRTKIEALKNEIHSLKDSETSLSSYFLTIYNDQKQITQWLDLLKNVYIVENTKMIQLDEICVKQKNMLKEA